MTAPKQAAKGLTKTMRFAIEYGIAGSSMRTLDALERRGIIQESERRPGHLELSPVGLCVRTIVMGHDPECLSDADRIALRQMSGSGFVGPAEWEECDLHPGHGSVYRWAWDGLADGETHEDAITGSEPCCLASCPLCEPGDEDEP
jgi:hypothetical protein